MFIRQIAPVVQSMNFVIQNAINLFPTIFTTRQYAASSAAIHSVMHVGSGIYCAKHCNHLGAYRPSVYCISLYSISFLPFCNQCPSLLQTPVLNMMFSFVNVTFGAPISRHISCLVLHFTERLLYLWGQQELRVQLWCHLFQHSRFENPIQSFAVVFVPHSAVITFILQSSLMPLRFNLTLCRTQLLQTDRNTISIRQVDRSIFTPKGLPASPSPSSLSPSTFTSKYPV